MDIGFKIIEDKTWVGIELHIPQESDLSNLSPSLPELKLAHDEFVERLAQRGWADEFGELIIKNVSLEGKERLSDGSLKLYYAIRHATQIYN